MKIFIGDIHGQIYLLDRLINKLINLGFKEDSFNDDLWLSGDLFDRNYEEYFKYEDRNKFINAKDVVDYIINNNLNSVIGNHDAMLYGSFRRYEDFLSFKDKERFIEIWTLPNNGGKNIFEFLKSNNIYRDKVLNYIENMPMYKLFEDEKLIISHSLTPQLIYEYSNIIKDFEFFNINGILRSLGKGAFIWSNEALNSLFYYGCNIDLNKKSGNDAIKDYKFAIGHFIVDNPIFNLNNNLITTDTGAFYTGKLTAAIIDKDMCEFIIVD